MSAENKTKNLDYRTLSSRSAADKIKASENGKSIGTNNTDGFQTLKPSVSGKKEAQNFQTLTNSSRKKTAQPPVEENYLQESTTDSAEETILPPLKSAERFSDQLSYAEEQKIRKQQKAGEKDIKILSRDHWLARNGHTLTYAGIFLFTLFVYFRPYELIPGLSGLSSAAMIIAVATLLVYLPTQLAAEGSLTTLSTEVKCVLFMALWAVLTLPIAKDKALAWETFNDTFSKVVIIFIVMVNTLRTESRMKGLMWLSIGVGVMLSFQAVELYRQGIFEAEGYRVQVDFGGMFGNPNDLAMHLVIFTPVAFALGLAAKKLYSKIIYFTASALMVAGNMVTQSRGGFLGLIAVAAVLAWKLGKKQRLKVTLASLVIGSIVIALAPGNYGLRILSIFIPALDTAGSSDQRSELLKQSIIVTLRNPWGIGIGNFPVVGLRNLQTHNAYTQVSSELGVLALVAYVALMVSPLRKLAAIERQMFAAQDSSWIYFLSIGLQASIIGYMVSSFFGPVAYNWFVYYPIAYAVCLRRIYSVSHGKDENAMNDQSGLINYFKLQKA